MNRHLHWIGALALAATASAASVVALGEGWTTDFEAASASAAEAKHDMILDFTGSDW